MPKYWKYADPIDGARFISRAEANEIRKIDAGLIVEIMLTCPHCGAPLCIGECTSCFWIEEKCEIVVHGWSTERKGE